jgi:hypothetical protein
MGLSGEASALHDELVRLRRELHRQPELGLDLPRTQERVLAWLRGLPLEISTGRSLSSVTAVLAGGVGVGHRGGVVEVEDQGKVEGVGAGDQGFLQDAVAPDAFEGDAAQLVLVEVVRRDRSGAQGADARDQDVPVGGVRPGGAPVSEPGQQRIAGELAQALPVAGEGAAPAGAGRCRPG